MLTPPKMPEPLPDTSLGVAAGDEPAELERLRADLADLRDHVLQSDFEIDDLRIKTAEARLPWYRNIQSLVAVLALLLSLSTTVVSGYWARTQGEIAEQRLRQQEIHDARTELRGLLQALSELARKNEELVTMSDSLAASRLSSSYASETSILLSQALELMDTIPDHVSSSEYLSVALPLAATGDYGRAETRIERAIELASNAFDYTSAIRTHAMLLFLKGDFEGGRARLTEALDAWSVFPPLTRFEQTVGDWTTEMTWADQERIQGNCDEAKDHLNQARAYLTDLGNAAPSAYQRQYAALAQFVAQCIPGEATA